jgi:hypothetical protein
MSDQATGHAYTTWAATQLFFKQCPKLALQFGLGPWTFCRKLEEGQHSAGRASANPFQQPGNKWLWWIKPEVPPLSALPNPRLSGDVNLALIRGELQKTLVEAYRAFHAGDVEKMFKQLGTAIHSVQDSFNGTWILRDQTNPSDPHTRVVALHAFHLVAGNTTEASATPRVERPADQASERATTEILVAFATHLSEPPEKACQAFREVIAPLFQGEQVQVLSGQNSPASVRIAKKSPATKPREPLASARRSE